MGLSYNSWVSPSYIYQDNGGSFSANQTGVAAFDYFPDDAAPNDALYFGNSIKFDDIQVNIGTAFAAAAATFVWEYYNGSAWTALTVTDGTSKWTATGSRTVTFVPPTNWTFTTINAIDGFWIRCRVSAVTTPTEGGANATTACAVGDNLLIVTGYSEGAPCTFDTLNAAYPDVFEKFGQAMYHQKCRLQIGDGVTATWLIETGKHLEVNDYLLPWSYERSTLVKTNAHVRFGTVTDTANKLGENGVSISAQFRYDKIYIFDAESGSTVEMYGSYFCGSSYVMYVSAHTFWQNLFGSVAGLASVLDMYRITFASALELAPQAGAAIDDVTGFNTAVITNVALVARNLNIKFADSTPYAFFLPPWTGDAVVTDCSLKKLNGDDLYTIYFHFESNYKVYRKYTFELTVKYDGSPVVGAAVAVRDKNGDTVFTGATGVDGAITPPEITVQTTERDPAETTFPHHVNIITDYFPFTYTVVADGCEPYTDIIELQEKTTLEINLKRAMTAADVAAAVWEKDTGDLVPTGSYGEKVGDLKSAFAWKRTA